MYYFALQFLAALLMFACSSDQTVGQPLDCRENGIGCTLGFICERDPVTGYECLPQSAPEDANIIDAQIDFEPLDARVAVDVEMETQDGCIDGVKNGDETDVDCGGSCVPCTSDASCIEGMDCESGVCFEENCARGTCIDGVKNGDETHVDCGGSCIPCTSDASCIEGMDCESGVCFEENCARGTCIDGVKNGDETHVDCGGGLCAGCIDGAQCAQGDDCRSGVCDEGLCVQSSCADAVINGAETDQDCGGACAPCSADSQCGVDTDCLSQLCVGFICQAPSCVDSVLNGTEPSIDCGGECPVCSDGDACVLSADCGSGVCSDGACQASRCGDGVRNGSEGCDDGNMLTEVCDYGVAQCMVCATDCMETFGETSVCGDGNLDPLEACDDGNRDDTDGCDSGCAIEDGYTCPPESSGQCVGVHGDGLVRGNEDCDDGNVASGDGCTEAGEVEDGWRCEGEPSICMVEAFTRIGWFDDLGEDSTHRSDYLLGSLVNIAAPETLIKLGYLGRVAGGRVRMAVYNNTNGLPGTLVTATQPGETLVGVVELDVEPIVLQPGAYWLMTLFEDDTSIGIAWDGSVSALRQLPFNARLPENFGPAETFESQTYNIWMVMRP